jgi:hypothetical protein
VKTFDGDGGPVRFLQQARTICPSALFPMIDLGATHSIKTTLDTACEVGCADMAEYSLASEPLSTNLAPTILTNALILSVECTRAQDGTMLHIGSDCWGSVSFHFDYRVPEDADICA